MFAAQAKVTEQQLNLGYATIRSPVTGLASRALQRQGAYINALSENAKLTYVAAPIEAQINGVDNLLYFSSTSSSELNAVSTQADRLTQLINVYKAMGGGWVDRADAIASPQHE